MKRLLTIAFVLAAAANSTAASNFDIWRRKPAGMVVGFDFSGGRTTSPTGHSGTLFGNAIVANGTRYVACDGSGDYLQVADAPEFTFNIAGQDQPFSVECCVFLSSTPSGNVGGVMKASSGTTYEWVLRPSSGAFNRPQFVLLNSTASAFVGRAVTTSLSTGQWHYLVGTSSGNEQESGIKLFVDGAQADNLSVSTGAYTGMSNTTSPVTIGTGQGAEYLNGKIAAIRIYAGELSPAEISRRSNQIFARIANGGTP